ncbi:MAG: universal stress protein [Deltaproteobacteria bacterium]|nr:universal stress protein [Deltaproteobacteria bacterium]
MFQRILVIFENERICGEALSYSRELALRMDSEVVLLMLVEMPFPNHVYLGSERNAIRGLESRMGKLAGELTPEFLKDGVSVSVALRFGDAAHELLKFLAERPPFQTVIWGSDEDLPELNPPRRRHWMGKVVNNLECPLLAVTGKAGRKRKNDEHK